MQRRSLIASACVLIAGTIAAMSPVRAEDPIRIAGVLELSGGGAGVGANFKNGMELATDEINASGGVLGRPLALQFYDNQSNPAVARAQMQRAIDSDPFVIVGPTFSGAAKASMGLAKQAGIPQFTGGIAPDLTHSGNPFIFRTYSNQMASVPKIMDYLAGTMKAKSIVVLWANDDMGKGGHDMVMKEAKARGITIIADLSAENNQVDFSSDVLKVKQSNADAIFMLIHEEETARFLKEAQKQGIGVPAIGDSMMLNPKVLDLAGDAGVGARGFVGLTGDAPVKAMQDMSDRFKARFGYAPDHNGFQGYIVMYVIKTITNRIGKVDHAAFATALHGATITVEQEPGVLLTTTWNGDGDLDRDTFLAQVEPGNRQKIIAVLARNPTP